MFFFVLNKTIFDSIGIFWGPRSQIFWELIREQVVSKCINIRRQQFFNCLSFFYITFYSRNFKKWENLSARFLSFFAAWKFKTFFLRNRFQVLKICNSFIETLNMLKSNLVAFFLSRDKTVRYAFKYSYFSTNKSRK